MDPLPGKNPDNDERITPCRKVESHVDGIFLAIFIYVCQDEGGRWGGLQYMQCDSPNEFVPSALQVTGKRPG
jgi:hypothetical protein